jgi:stage V sporulation protein AB
MKTMELALVGLSSGFVVAAAMFALIATIGLLSRLAQVTRSAWAIRWYEDCFVAGAILGNAIYIYRWSVPAGKPLFLGIAGVFIGSYIGCFIGALAEIVNVFPILFHRIHLRQGLKALIWALAIGKVIGGIVYFFM